MKHEKGVQQNTMLNMITLALHGKKAGFEKARIPSLQLDCDDLSTYTLSESSPLHLNFMFSLYLKTLFWSKRKAADLL